MLSEGKFLLILTWGVLLNLGCSAGGNVTASLNQPSAPVFVAIPTVSLPSDSPHYSKDDNLQISGLCNSGNRVILSGADFQEQPCVNSTYTFTINKTSDGIYAFMLTQLSTSGLSAANMVFWVRKSSIMQPIVTSPSESIYKSGSDKLQITGFCETGATVSIEGDGYGSTPCTGSVFNIEQVKYTDGDYQLVIKQTDLAGNSASVNLDWQKRTLSASPSALQLTVTSSQVFTLDGGSGIYSGSLVTNNSGSTYDDETRTYVAGTLAEVNDVIRFTDSAGSTLDISILTKASQPDHFEWAADNGDSQTQGTNREFDSPFTVRVVDRYNNPIPRFDLIFGLQSGDGNLLDPPRQTTDTNGYASVRIKSGTRSTRSLVAVKPAVAPLPDEAGTGLPTTTLRAYTTMNNNSELGDVFALGTSPKAPLISDFDGDGNMDVALLNSNEPSIGIFFGKGNGLFHPMSKIRSICSNSVNFALHDINGDSFLDFIIACGISDRLTLVLAQGDGTFLPPMHINVELNETTPLGLTAADFNGDGYQDLASVSITSTVSLRLGAADGSYGAPSYFAVGNGPSQIETGDFNHDLLPDLAILNSADDSVGLLLNDGNGGFTPHISYGTGSAPAAMKVFDVNGDGWLDVSVINNGDSTLSVMLNDQAGELLSGLSAPVGVNPTSLNFIHLNDDGLWDVLVTNTVDNNLSVLLGVGDGTFMSQPPISTITEPGWVANGDFNGDSTSDVVVVSTTQQTMQVLPNSGQGRLGYLMNTESTPTASVLADLDEDGIADLMIAQKGNNSVKVLKGDGKGLWSQMTTLTTANGPSHIAASDVNLDGHIDLVVSHQNVPLLRVYKGIGNGDFDPPDEYSVGLQSTFVVAADLNNDGFPDLATANSGSNSLTVLSNLGDGTFANRLDLTTDTQPSAVAVGDLNGDLEPDLISVNQGSGSVSVLFSTGGIAYQTRLDFSTAVGSTSLAIGFFNSDDYLDIATASPTDGSVSILLGSSNGSLQNAMTFTANGPAYSLVTSDFNGDSRQDLLVGNGSDQSLTILFGSGNGQFNSSKSISSPHAPESITLGDINNDGAVDLITLDPINASALSWLGF